MKWLLFAFNNVLRNRRRSVITMLIVGIGGASLMIAGGFGLFTYESLREMTARETGHLVIAHQHYFDRDEEQALEFGLPDYQHISANLKQRSDTRFVIPRLQFSGLVSNGEKSAIFLGTGVDPSVEFRVSGPFLDVLEGHILKTDTNPDDEPEALIAQGLARSMNVQVGSILTLLTTTTEGGLNGLDVKVVGIISTGKPEMDERKLLVSLPTAQDILVTDKISALSVYLHDMNNVATVQQELVTAYPDLSLRSWADLANYYFKVRGLYNRIFGVMGLIIILMVFFAVTNTITMTVVERTREIGTLRALGSMPGQIVRVFILESACIGIIGALLAVILTAIVSLSLVFAGIQMPPPPGMTTPYPLFINFSLMVVGLTTSSLLIISVIAAWHASIKGARKPIVEALTHV